MLTVIASSSPGSSSVSSWLCSSDGSKKCPVRVCRRCASNSRVPFRYTKQTSLSPSRRISRYERLSDEHVNTAVSFAFCFSSIAARIVLSHGQRSSSVSGMPWCIFSLLAAL